MCRLCPLLDNNLTKNKKMTKMYMCMYTTIVRKRQIGKNHTKKKKKKREGLKKEERKYPYLFFCVCALLFI